MTISEIGQTMPMPGMYGMQPPDANEVASHLISEIDADEDGILSAEEINQADERAQRILDADVDGDGYVTEEELIDQISQKMESREGIPEFPQGDKPDINQIKTFMTQVGMEQSGQTDQTGTDLISQFLQWLEMPQEEADNVLAMMQNSCLSLYA